MSNFDKASNLARAWVESMGGLEAVRHDYGSDLSGLMQALDDAWLLMPDLPEPKPYGELAEFGDEKVMAARGTSKVRIYIDDPRMSSESARELALMLLAAADYAEKGEDHE